MPKLKRSEITQDILKRALCYDRSSGHFTWAFKPNRRIAIGSRAGFHNGHGYMAIRLYGIIYMAHHLAWLWEYGHLPRNEIDHINRNSQDNRIENLRDVPKSVNCQNRTKALSHNKTGVLGVASHHGSYQVVIGVNRKQKYIGRFRSIGQAEAAYLKAKAEFHPNGVIA